MRKRIVIAVIMMIVIGAFVTSDIDAGKKPKTGETKDHVYRDFRFGFSVEYPADWKASKPKKEYHPLRFLVQEKGHIVPVKLRNNPEYAVKPTMMIFADSTNLTPEQFFTYLQSDSGKSEFKTKILQKSILLDRTSRYEMEVVQRRKAKVLGVDAVKIKGRVEYVAQVTVPGRGPQVVKDYRSGFIYLVPFEGWLLYIEQYCENELLPSQIDAFDSMISSLTFTDPEAVGQRKETSEK